MSPPDSFGSLTTKHLSMCCGGTTKIGYLWCPISLATGSRFPSNRGTFQVFPNSRRSSPGQILASSCFPCMQFPLQVGRRVKKVSVLFGISCAHRYHSWSRRRPKKACEEDLSEWNRKKPEIKNRITTSGKSHLILNIFRPTNFDAISLSKDSTVIYTVLSL